jgi:hypothetical protein
MIARDFSTDTRQAPMIAGLPGHLLSARDHGGLREAHGLSGCADSLNITRPKLVRGIHARFLDAGANALFTNTAGAAPQLLDRYRMFDEAFSVSYLGAGLAAGTTGASSAQTIIGDVRIPWRRRMLGFISHWEMEDTAHTLTSAHVAGGAGTIWLEAPHMDAQMRAAVTGARAGMAEAGRRVPLILSVRHELAEIDQRPERIADDLGMAAARASGLGVDSLAIASSRLTSELIDTLKAWKGPLAALASDATSAAELVSNSTIAARLNLIGLSEPKEVRRLVRWFSEQPAQHHGDSTPMALPDNDNHHASIGRSA